MKMSNSPLVDYTKISPNSTNPRKDAIKKITIHHVAGNLSVETIGNIFQSTTRQASANYGVGTDGRVGMYVEEKNRSWCSSSAANDNQAITIEVSNDEIGGNWHVSDAALAKTIELCVDICKRNGITKLVFTGDATGNLTQHNYFAATACPGPYLKSKYPYIAEQVNKQLVVTPEQPTAGLKVGDIVNFAGGLHYSSSKASTGSKVSAGTAKITQIAAGAKHPYHVISEDKKKSSVYGWVDTSTISKVVVTPPSAPAAPQPYTVKVTADALNIRRGPGTNYKIVGQTGKGVFTIVEEALGAGATKWGKLKSGAGWISLDFVEGAKPVVDTEIKLNDIINFKGGNYFVSSTGGKHYTGKPGKAKVTQIVKGAKYPYHVIRTDNTTSVYGWVAADLVRK